MIRKRVLLFAALSLTAAIAAGYLIVRVGSLTGAAGEQRHNRTLEQIGLIVEAKDLNFGETWETRDFPWQLRLRNRGNHLLRILSVRSSCSCLSVSPSSLTLPPGQKVSLKLKLDLRPGTSGKCDADRYFDFSRP